MMTNASRIRLCIRARRRLDAEGACLEAQAAGRVRVLLLNGVLLSRSSASGDARGSSSGGERAASGVASAGAAAQLAVALESLRVRLRMAGLIPPTPAAPPRRALRRTASDESQNSAAHAAHAPATHGDATAAVARARALAAAAAPQQQHEYEEEEEEEAAQQRPQSPLFSFRCPITHVRVCAFCDAHLFQLSPRIGGGGAGGDARPGGCRRWALVRCASSRSDASIHPRSARCFDARCVCLHPPLRLSASAERSAISRWLQRSARSPCTNLALPHARLTPNHSLRAAIAEWAAAGGGASSEAASPTA